MASDVEEMMTRLGQDADAIALPPADAARRRGERVRRHRRVAAVVACAVLIAAVAGAGAWLLPDGPVKPAPLPSTVAFQPLERIGEPVPVGTGDVPATTAVVGQRGYAAWRESDGTLKVTAVSLATGRPDWPPVTLGKFGDSSGMIATPEGLYIIGEHDRGSSALDSTMFVVDPDSGAIRWQREFSVTGDTVVLHASALVLASSTERRTLGLDWRTGRTLWSHAIAAGVRTFGVRTDADAPYAGGSAAMTTRTSDPRYVEVAPGGDVSVYEAATGRRLAGWTVANLTERSDILAVNDLLYIGTGTRVRVSSLDGGAPREFDAPGEVEPRSMQPCGVQAICFTWGNPSRALSALDPSTGRVLWGVNISAGSILIPVGDRVLVRVHPEDKDALYAPGGRQLLAESDRSSWTWPIDGGSLLSLRGGLDGPGEVEVLGIAAADGRSQVLGRITVTPMTCSWNEATLFCTAPDGLRVWRFAR